MRGPLECGALLGVAQNDYSTGGLALLILGLFSQSRSTAIVPTPTHTWQ